ncbi:hypothetical protein H5410_015719 [Solanum commersonii]|uniref:Uncharacterized protein n=1 Tax=Solanum commersonii TaxID=4109 RepID=A0A9J5ZVC5_SOLCO|nr:hypothetical protein H5410_015719 [Solanum commersonii]
MPQKRNVNEGRGRGRRMPQHSQTSSEATSSARGLEKGKRPVEHEDTNFIYKPKLLSRRVNNTGTRVTKRVDAITDDIGYTPRRGFKWKGKTTITSGNLERMRTEKVDQTRSAATANNQSQTSSSRKTLVPWK